ncbi:MAG: membrane protein insertase YidC [Candidatus Marinimicrobia bacterium]|jgi:YidC/Oxa1 family membrane protein insertase|nr:membrane protein insertase YidC [Candidatus Neomarinimicrobiota bacterium]
MDRKTLFAFLLIAVIILITPVYYNLLYPPVESVDTDSTMVEAREPVSKKTPYVNSVKKVAPITETIEAREEIYYVETDLYSATISSNNGGSITSFTLNNYSYLDSGLVQLINEDNSKNLLLSFRSIDGEAVELSGPWESVKNVSPGYIQKDFSLEFKKFLGGVWIYKTLTFYPDNYTINVKTDFSSAESFLSQGVFNLSWDGGLPITEKNVSDDLNYFNSYIYQGGELHSPKLSEEKTTKEDNIKGGTAWVAIRSKYFVSALIPEAPGIAGQTSGYKRGDLEKIYSVGVSLSAYQHKNTRLYLGPLEYSRIKALRVDLDSIMNFGWSLIRPIAKGVHFLLIKMQTVVPNYGVVLVLFSLLIKIIVYPLTKKSYESTQKMQAVQPQLNALKEKYKNDQQKMSQAQMALFKEHGVNPLGGCFPILLQMPLLFSLFQVFRSTIELRGAPFVLWIKDLSSPDTIVDLPFTIPIYGDHIAVLPILMGITMFLQQKMMPTQASGQQKYMSYFMTIFFTLLFNNFPSGLNLYYTLFNLLTILQQKYLTPATTPLSETALKRK